MVVLGVHQIEIGAQLEAQVQFGDALEHHLAPADQDGEGDAFVHHRLHGHQHAAAFTLGEHHAALVLLGAVEHRLHHQARAEDELRQRLVIGGEVDDGPARHAGIHGGAGHRRRDLQDQARIERLGDQIFGAEGQRLLAVGGAHALVRFRHGQLGQGVGGGQLHVLVDLGGAHVQRAAEDVGEHQHVVDLVRIIRPAGGDDGVGTHRLHLFRQDFRGRVGQGEHDGLVRHGRDHFGGQHARRRQAHEDVRAGDDLGQGALVGLLGEDLLVGVHQLVAALVDHALDVGDPDVLALDADADQQVQARQRGGAGARRHQLDLADVLADDAQRVDHGRRHHDGGAVLVVMHDRDGQALFELPLHLEAFGGLDVLQIDGAEGRLHGGDHVDQPVGVQLVDLHVEDVDAGELLEQDALALHHRLGGQRPDVAQAQHGGAVGDHGNKITARGHFHGGVGIGDNGLAGGGDARAVGQGEVALVC